jgi:hypothetical protein
MTVYEYISKLYNFMNVVNELGLIFVSSSECAFPLIFCYMVDYFFKFVLSTDL